MAGGSEPIVTDVKRRTLRDAWRLAKPYWSGDDKGWASALLGAVAFLTLFSVGINFALNIWRGAFFNAVQQLDERQFFVQIGWFLLLSLVSVGVFVYQLYLQQMLQIRWRRWLTPRFLNAWLNERAYYRLQVSGGGTTDNPDQRIADDLERFTRHTLLLTVGTTSFLSATVSLVVFGIMLYGLSGTLEIPLGPLGKFELPGYLMWAALLYAVVGTWLTFKIGRPLVRLNFDQQRYEADFRFSLVRLRENTESVAFYSGEPRELCTFADRFSNVVTNFWGIMRRVKVLGWYTKSYDQLAIVFPFLVAGPELFSGRMQLGGLMQTAAAFFEVQVAMSFIVKNYIEIAEWQSVVERLIGFDRRIREIAAAARAPQQIAITCEPGGLDVADLELDLPDGTPLLREVSFSVPPGEALLISGPTGTGKSTLLRAIAGIWPYGRGQIRMCEGRSLFLPQRPYLPLGSLRNAVLYPREDAAVPEARIAAVLVEVGLAELVDQLDSEQNWSHRLSLGEQQRLAFARVLLIEPTIVFLDEASSALDEASEAQLYRMLRQAPWKPAMVSVGHRGTLRGFHDRVLDLGAMCQRRAALSLVT
jgi:vitamin B12/bleomycin/antimicrobial peptide transport system ATP-binding/permease protein